MPSIDLNQAIQFIVILLISIDLHELAHAVTAYRLGDSTPQRNGQLSLNPFVHMDQVGVLVLVISALAGYPFAWGRTFIQPQNLRFGPQRGGAIVAAAGPLTNLALAGILAIAFNIAATSCNVGSNTLQWIFLGIYVNLALFVFNLIPLPPLDGFTILGGFLTARQLYALAPVVQYGPIILLLLITLSFAGSSFNVLGGTVFYVINHILQAILPSSTACSFR